MKPSDELSKSRPRHVWGINLTHLNDGATKTTLDWLSKSGKTRYTFSAGVSLLSHCVLAAALIWSNPFEPPPASNLQEISFLDLTDFVEPEPEAVPLRETMFESPAAVPDATPANQQVQRETARVPEETSAATPEERAIIPALPAARSPITIARTGAQDVLKLASASEGRPDRLTRPVTAPVELENRRRPRIVAASMSRPVPASRRAVALKTRGSEASSHAPATPAAEQSAARSNLMLGDANAIITGPLSSRAILQRVVPKFPAWAKSKSVSAQISLQFSVLRNGLVRENVVVVHTSGSSEWDALVIAALRQWRFQPLNDQVAMAQSGVITFQFVAE